MSGSYEVRRTQQTILVVVVAISAAVALPALLGSWLLRRALPHQLGRVLVVVVMVAGVAGLYLLRDQVLVAGQDLGWALVDVDTEALPQHLGWLWLLTLPAAPLLALFIDATRRRNPEQQELEATQRRTAAKERRRDRARQKANTAPEQIGGELVLGAAGEGDLVGCVRGDYLVLPMDVLQRHLIAVGGSGMGKTETILRIAVLVAKHYGWTVVFLDAKGDADTSTRFAQTMRLAGITRVAAFPDQPFFCWNGSAKELLNRLMEIEEYSEPYYKSISKLMLSLACYAPQGPPRGSTELLQRLRKSTLKALYKDRPEADEINGITEKDAAGVYNRYRAFFLALQGQVDGTWSYDDVDACYIRLDGTALKEEAASLGRFLLEEFTQWAALRKPRDQHVLLIVDEWSALSKSDTDVDNMFERMRSFNAHIIVSAQGYAGLGENAERMLDAAAGVILHASNKPDDLIERAGTVKVIERSVQKDTLGATGMGSLRAQESFRINPNDAGQLGKGECFIMSGRRAQWVKVQRMDRTPTVSDGAAHQQQLAEGLRARYQARARELAGSRTQPHAHPAPTAAAPYDPADDWMTPGAVAPSDTPAATAETWIEP